MTERLRMSGTPLWWRIPVWAAITAVTAYTPPQPAARIAGGVLCGLGAVVLQANDPHRRAVRQAIVLAATALGFAACFASQNGLAEIVIVIAATKAPDAFDGLAIRVFLVLDTIAFGATVGFISRSYAGALAGTAIPLVIQRAVDHRNLVLERDRAQALLVEVQNARESEARAAALQERGRIAREMHDVLAHSLAGLSVQLQATRAIAAKEGAPDTVLAPLDKAATLARDGLAEARAAVSTLRDPVGLSLDALPPLVDRHPGVATLTSTGQVGPVSPDAGHAVYRAVQESLTNAARYAPGSAVSVQLRWAADTLAVTVEDTGPAPGRSAVAGQGTGLGLAGMDERVQHVGGTLRAGPRPDGGWRVELSVPTTHDVEPADVGRSAAEGRQR